MNILKLLVAKTKQIMLEENGTVNYNEGFIKKQNNITLRNIHLVSLKIVIS